MLKRYHALHSFILVALMNGASAEEVVTNDVSTPKPSEQPKKVLSNDIDVKKADKEYVQADGTEQNILNGKTPKTLKLSAAAEKQTSNSTNTAPKQAENIDLKEVVEEPLEASEPVDQTAGTDIEKTDDGSNKTVKDEKVEALEPAENIDLKEVVDQPLKANEPITENEKVVDNTKDKPKKETSSTTNSESNNEKPSADIAEKKSTEENSNKASNNESLEPISEAVDENSADKDLVSEKQEQQDSDQDSVNPNTGSENNAVTENKPKEKTGLLTKLAQELTGNDSDKEEQKPLLLLNSEVLPGTSTRLGWSPSVSFIGISAPTAVLVLNGVKPGPTLCLTAAVHGDELNGIEIVRRVMYDIDPKQLSGAVIGVPIVNLQGFRRSSRYLPDRRDLNRFFPGNPEESSAARIAYSFFSEVITHCDMLIDLHTGSFRRTNLPQLRADLNYPNVASLAEKLGAIVVVQSEGAVGSLRRAAVENGIASVTLEAGAPHELQKNAVEHGVKSIESAMDSLGMIKRRRFWERSAEPVYYKSTWVRAREGGILFSEVSLGARVKQGDLLGVVTDPITNIRSQIISPFDGRVIGMALNQVMFPGFAAYHIGLKASVEETPKGKVLVSENEIIEKDGTTIVNTLDPEKVAEKSIKGNTEKTTLTPVVDEIDPVVETETIDNIMPPSEDSE